MTSKGLEQFSGSGPSRMLAGWRAGRKCRCYSWETTFGWN